LADLALFLADKTPPLTTHMLDRAMGPRQSGSIRHYNKPAIQTAFEQNPPNNHHQIVIIISGKMMFKIISLDTSHQDLKLLDLSQYSRFQITDYLKF
jgi:hypothetical protein